MVLNLNLKHNLKSHYLTLNKRSMFQYNFIGNKTFLIRRFLNKNEFLNKRTRTLKNSYSFFLFY